VRFYKYHALGNDYLVLDPIDGDFPSAADTIRICHRNFGLGSDGILYGPSPSEGADFGLRILNPDGSEAEKSGNGLRIFCRYLFDQKKVEAEKEFTIETLGGIVSCTVSPGAELITVEMGQVSFVSDRIGVTGPVREVLDETITIQGNDYRYYAATIGNPHCVLPMDEISSEMAHRLGPDLEREARFKKRTNVQFLKVLDRNNIQIEIWERGAGYTLASGSSSSAAGAVARKMGAVDDDITVHMPGGKIQLHIDSNYQVRMTGPATRVAQMELDLEALR
jgi:diaminopimelate epimerase